MPHSKNPFTITSADIEGGDLRGKYKKIWTEESFDVERSGDSKLSIAHTKNYLGISIAERSLAILFFLVLSGFLFVYGRVFYLQIIRGSYYHNLAEGNRIRLEAIPSERGIIFDRFNHELVRNVPSFSLALVPQDLPKNVLERAAILDMVTSTSGMSVEEMEQLVHKYSSYGYDAITLKGNLDYTTALKLYVLNAGLPGVQIKSGSQRKYSASSSTVGVSLSPLIGYLAKLNDQELTELHANGYLASDDIGKVGIEKSYESDLRGTYGRKKIEVNAAGKEQNVLAVEAPIPGKNVTLTIDLDAQKKLENLVKNTAEKIHNRRIVAIAMNSNNGEVLAMVNWPTFDNNKFSGGIDQATYNSYINDPDLPLFNRAIAGTFPPGSTVKLIVAAAALQEKIVTKSTVINSVGGIVVGGQLFKDWKAGGHGATNVLRALAWSVNTFFYYVGGGYKNFTGMGVDTISQYYTAFGLAHLTGIDIPGEKAGFIPSKDWKKELKNEIWYVGDTYNISIGQGDLLVTPLQVAEWTAAVANGGTMVTPHFGKSTTDPLTKQVSPTLFVDRPVQSVSEQNLAIVREGMRDCVVYGSCQPLKSLQFEAAGKTGTAQWSKTHPTHAWFTSFAPYKDPQIVVTVLVENGGEGSVVALPIANGFLDWWGKKYLSR